MKKVYILIIILSLAASCKDEYYAEGKIETKEATDITGSSATLRGNISISNNPKMQVEVARRGFVYAESREQLENSNRRVYDEINSTGSFSANIFDLKPQRRYYAQAFFILLSPYDSHILYGNIIEFTTLNAYIKSYILDNGIAEYGWRQGPGYGNSYGNMFVVGETGELTSVDVYGFTHNDASSRTVTIDVYNNSKEWVGSSEPFILSGNGWKNVPLDNISYSSTFYVMVRWSASSGETNYLGIDTYGTNATKRLGYFLWDDKWYVYEDIYDYGSEKYYRARGVWLIRANAISFGKSVSYGTEPIVNESQPNMDTLKIRKNLDVKQNTIETFKAF